MNGKSSRAIMALLIAGCVFLFVFKISPLFMSLGLSFRDYKPFSGFFGSPWVGFRNFKNILSNFVLPRIFSNTLRLNFFSALLALPIAGVFVYCANRIRSRKLAFILTAVFALASIFPRVIFGGFITFALGIEINAYYGVIYTLFEAVRLAGFAALGAYFMSLDSDYSPGGTNTAKLTLTVLAVALLAGLSKLLSSDFELASIMQNPFIYDRAEVIDTFYYKTGFVQMHFGTGSALWLIKYMIELIIGALAAVGVFFVLKAANKTKFGQAAPGQNGTIAAVVCAVMAAAVATACVIALFPMADADAGLGNINIGMNVMFITMSLLVSFASAALAGVLAYPFASPKASHKIIYAAFLVPSLYAANIVQRYILYRGMGIVNTLFPMMLNGFLPVWMMAAYAIILNRPSAKDILITKDYVKYISPATVIMAAINFSFMWGNFGPSMIYATDPSRSAAALALRNAMAGGTQSFALILIVFIPIIMVWAASVASAAFIKRKNEADA